MGVRDHDVGRFQLFDAPGAAEVDGLDAGREGVAEPRVAPPAPEPAN
jgi:hypothetical protein